HWIEIQHAERSGVGRQKAADKPDCRRLARAVGPDQAEHLPAIHVQRERVDCRRVAVAFGDALEHNRARHGRWSGISASTGMPAFSTPFRLSMDTFTRYTSFARSSAVCTLRGVNSAFCEM